MWEISCSLTENWGRMQMKHRILRYGLSVFLVLAAIFAAGNGGLAKEEYANAGSDAYFCGVLLVEGEKDSQEDLKWDVSGSETGRVNDRIEGVKDGDGWHFPGLEGKILMCYTEGAYGSEDAVASCASDPDLGGIALNVNVDYGERTFSDKEASGSGKREVCGTLYVSPDYDRVLWMHPVYERADGSIFAAADEAEALRPDSLDFTTTGEAISGSMERSDRVTWGGNTREESTKITVSVKAAEEIRRVLIKEYRADDTLMKETEISGDALKSGERNRAFTLQKDTAYVIVEEHKTAIDGEERIEHSVFDWGDAYNDHYQAIQPSKNSIARLTVFTWVKS